MNSLFLLGTAAAVLVLGYRFYSKLLALGVFRLDPNYSTPAHTRVDAAEFVATNRHIALGQHFAITAGATTVTGTAIAVIWGWVPAFLWALVGTAVAAGVYGIGTLWLAAHAVPGEPGAIVSRLVNRRARVLFLLLALVVLLLLNAVSAGLAAALLSAYPSAVLPFWIQLPLAFGLGVFIYRRGSALLPASVIAMVVALVVLWTLGNVRFAFSGALNLDVRGHSLISVDATFLWVMLLFVSAYYSARLPVRTLIQPRAYLAALQTAALVVALLAGVAILHPPIVAPNFHAAWQAPATIPWIFVTLTSGAIAGFYLLFATGVTGRQLERETDARYVGYGTALAEGVLALSVVLVCAAAFGSEEEWKGFYTSWGDAAQSLPGLLAVYINGFAKFMQVFGIGAEFARSLAAMVLATLMAVTLEAGIRVQKQLLVELGTICGVARATRERFALRLTVGATALLALSDGHGLGGATFWPLFGAYNQVLAAFGLLLIGFALRARSQPVIYLFAPLAFVAAVTVWALMTQLVNGWASGDWLLLTGAGVLLVAQAWLAAEAVCARRQLQALPPDA